MAHEFSIKNGHGKLISRINISTVLQDLKLNLGLIIYIFFNFFYLSDIFLM